MASNQLPYHPDSLSLSFLHHQLAIGSGILAVSCSTSGSNRVGGSLCFWKSSARRSIKACLSVLQRNRGQSSQLLWQWGREKQEAAAQTCSLASQQPGSPTGAVQMAARAEEMAPGRSSLCSRSGWLTCGAPMEKSKGCRARSGGFTLSVHTYFLVPTKGWHYSR